MIKHLVHGLCFKFKAKALSCLLCHQWRQESERLRSQKIQEYLESSPSLLPSLIWRQWSGVWAVRFYQHRTSTNLCWKVWCLTHKQSHDGVTINLGLKDICVCDMTAHCMNKCRCIGAIAREWRLPDNFSHWTSPSTLLRQDIMLVAYARLASPWVSRDSPVSLPPSPTETLQAWPMTAGFPWVLRSHWGPHIFTHPAISQAPNQDLQRSPQCLISSPNFSSWLAWGVLLQPVPHNRSESPRGHCSSLPNVGYGEWHVPCPLDVSLKGAETI